ncbi:MAG TPA: phosphatase PAP2 family protein [Bacteroidota bacterium]|nr:phosphatase PAP2 family protein [Bacteroidota bacterium]
MSEVLYGIDVAVFRFLNQTIANPVFDLLMPFLTDLNKQPIILFLVGAGLIALAVKGGVMGRTTVILLILTILLSDQLNSSVIKHLFTRIRPCHVLNDVHLLVGCGSGYSFPSSHAVNNVAAATVLSYFYRKWLWAFMTFAGVVAFSRVSVGVHYPFDILAGAVLGVVIGVLVLFGYRFIIGQWSRRQKTGESA